VFAARVLYAFLRGVSRDRLDLLGEEYFHYHLKPRLKRAGVEKLKGSQASGHSMVLVSHALEQVVRPLAQYLGIERVVANRLEFRDGRATGRLLEPVIRPRGGLAWVLGRGPDGTVSLEELPRNLGLSGAVHPAERHLPPRKRTLVLFQLDGRPQPLSVRKALAGKNVLLIGVTGDSPRRSRDRPRLSSHPAPAGPDSAAALRENRRDLPRLRGVTPAVR
jgi:hypothetical protein